MSSIASMPPTLGVNIDHLATLRQLRNTPYPNLLEVATIIEHAQANQITVHLREDRRHIQEADVLGLRRSLNILLNLEMAATDAMVQFACRVRPDWACIVPEKRLEITTEGGLDLSRNSKKLFSAVQKLKKARIRVSLFVEPSRAAIRASLSLKVDAVELHTGRFCLATQGKMTERKESIARAELARIKEAATLARHCGLSVHAGHGLDYENVRELAGLMLIEEFNIGHSIICRAAIVGLERAVREMVSAISAP